MTKLARYLFGNYNAETIATRTIDGEHWYMAGDICRLLDTTNHSTAVHRDRKRDQFTLADDEWRKVTIYIGGCHGKRYVLMVNDRGMMKLIFQGKSQIALKIQERFRNLPDAEIPEGCKFDLSA